MSSYDSSAKLRALRSMMLNPPSEEEQGFTVTITSGAKGASRKPQSDSSSDLSKYLEGVSPEDEYTEPGCMEEDDDDPAHVTPFGSGKNGGYLRGQR